MSHNNIYTVGIIGIFLSLVTAILKTTIYLNFFNIHPIIIDVIFTTSSILVFISIYHLFKYTENDKLGCKLNLIGVFSVIPLLIYNAFSFIILAFPLFLDFSMFMTVLGILLILGNVLVTLFLFSIYNNNVTKNLETPIYKLTLIFSSCCLVINSICNFSSNLIDNPFYESFLNTLGLFKYISAFIFGILLMVSYKNIITELIHISKNEVHLNI